MCKDSDKIARSVWLEGNEQRDGGGGEARVHIAQNLVMIYASVYRKSDGNPLEGLGQGSDMFLFTL